MKSVEKKPAKKATKGGKKLSGRKVGRKDTKPVNRGKAKRKRNGKSNGTH